MRRNNVLTSLYLELFPHLQEVLNNCKCNCVVQLYIIVNRIMLPFKDYDSIRIIKYR